MTPNPRVILDESSMSSSQKMAVLLTASLSALDGYDILSVSFAAPAISHEWAVGKTALGLVFSAGLGGMMMGSFLLAPLGDRIGRRAIVIVALILTGIGMALCATADGVPLLAAWRIVAGAGLGAMVAVINPLAVEFSNARFRTLAVAIMAIGFPLGGMCGGFACAALLAHFDWRAIFLCGASVSLALLPVTIFWLPESPSFLLTRRDDRSLDRLNTFLKRCGHLPLGMLPAAPLVSAAVPYRRILLGASRNRTLWITTVNFLFMMTVFFFLSWMPQIIVDRGFDASVASTTSGVASSCGVLSSIIVGLAAVRFRLRPMTAALSVTMGLSVMVFSIAPPMRLS